MFESKIYTNRRDQLKKEVKSGLIVILGNPEASFNYPANTYTFRQDSNFLYFFGLDHPQLAGVIDIDANKDYIYGDDYDLDDIIWMGFQPSISEQAQKAGIQHTGPIRVLPDMISQSLHKGQKVHYVPPYRGETFIQLSGLLGMPIDELKANASEELIRGIIKLRSVKDQFEIAEIEKAVGIAYEMHTTSMRMAYPGRVEREIAGRIEGISLSLGGPVSFPVILSINGETLHNHHHGNILKEGKMMVTDAGAETTLHYASDITRTVPVGGKFNQKQKDIYEIVLKANMDTIAATRPGITNRELHFMAARIISEGLKNLGLMKGNVDEAVNAGAHAMFFPHGLGHMLGLDVHDMEGMGENLIGYNGEIKRSNQFGTAFLRLAKKHQPGFVFTIEPGIYFIPALIDKWKNEKRFTDFISYDKVESYRDFGGIRIEDDVLVTDTGHRVLGKPIPKTVAEIEKTMADRI
jgi:Xaa-Pro aminopeptidase